MAMIPDGGLLMMASSVHRKIGYMYRRWKELHGRDDEEDLCWLSPSPVMNPALPAKVIERALKKGPQRAKAEYLSQWRDDVSDFTPMDILESATDFGVREPAPRPGVTYYAFTDAVGGTGKDSFSLCIAHREPDGIVTIDFLRERLPRFVPAAVVKEFAEILKLYRVTSVQGDRYSSGWNADEWKRAGFFYVPSERTKSELDLAALPMLLSGQVRLVDNEKMRRQFVGLERRVHPNGRESVDDSGAASANDDLSNACSRAMLLAATKKRPMKFSVPEISYKPNYATGYWTMPSHDMSNASGPPGGAPNPENEKKKEKA